VNSSHDNVLSVEITIRVKRKLMIESVTMDDWADLAKRCFRRFFELKWVRTHDEMGIRETFWDLDKLKFHEDRLKQVSWD